ncbi:MAG: DUF6151 family protein [Pseudomonadota bacterium]
MTDLTVSCDCGAFEGVLHDVTPKAGFHVKCFCRDCQTFPWALGKEASVLDDNGGTAIFQTSTTRLSIQKGKDNLAALRLTPKGIFRWYAKCCNTPIGNTMPGATFSFVGLLKTALQTPAEGASVDAAIGPVRSAAFKKQARGDIAEDYPGLTLSYALSMIGLLFGGAIRGEGKKSPFFSDGEPIAEPRLIDEAERSKISARMDAAS